MAMELPTDLINRLKKATRAEAGLSDDVFATTDNYLSPLPSLSEVVAAFDPSPPYLRCKNCHGRLLRGVESLLCIYCGRATDFDHPPISFKDSIAYRWLLESLDLDGSKLVTPPLERSESNLGLAPSKEEIPLSDLLDLKIQCLPKSDRKDYGSSNKDPATRTSTNFTGIDLNNFFSKSDLEDLSTAQEESSLTRKNMEVIQAQIDVPQHKTSLFESVQPFESAIKGDTDSSFTGWEADFQTAGASDQAVPLDHSGYHQEPSKLFEPVHITAHELPSEMNLAFADSEYFKDEKRKNNSVALPSSSDWMSEDLWANMNSTIPQQTSRSDENFPAKNSSTQDIISNIATGPNLFDVDTFSFDDPFPQTNYSTNNDDNKMLDDWNDFTSSPGIQAISQNNTSGNPNHSSNSDVLNFDKDFKEMDLSSFLQVGPVSTSSSKEPIQTMDNSLLEVSFLDRVVDYGTEGADNGAASEPGAAERSAEKSESNGKNKEVEMLISKMHDLSFMLGDELSIPKKSDRF